MNYISALKITNCLIMEINQKLAALRNIMKRNSIDAIIVPSSDPHQSEYIADVWKDRKYISGFTGSSGVAIVTQSHAGLWTDSRYFLQAEIELIGSDFVLHKLQNQFAPEHIEWLLSNLPSNSNVAIDGEDFSKAQYDNIVSLLKPHGIAIDITHDLMSEIWTDRPSFPNSKAVEHDVTFVGQNRKQKIENLRSEIIKHSANYLLLSALDEIAWTLNLRGTDVIYNPVLISYCIVGLNEVILFVDEDKVSEIKFILINDNVQILPYESIVSYLNKIDEKAKILVEANTINIKLYKAINGQILHIESPARISKGIKSQIEIDHYKKAMIADGVALAKAYKWLEDNIGKTTITEHSFAQKIANYRSEHQDYRGESFGAIVGYNGNGAIIHYNPSEENCSPILPHGILLVDCGGQYLGGTTDITRTIALSEPSVEAKKHNTLVLKGHLALSQVVFPKGSTGSTLDILARQFLWDNGLNYLHGTGHGVGYFLNVHEGPHGFAAPSTERGRTPLQEGMIITNEPGFYLTDQYGIRIENIMVVKPHTFENFLEFESITLYPYDLKLVDEKALTPKEKVWINKYHNHVYEAISPFLDSATAEWFRYKCKLLG